MWQTHCGFLLNTVMQFVAICCLIFFLETSLNNNHHKSRGLFCFFAGESWYISTQNSRNSFKVQRDRQWRSSSNYHPLPLKSSLLLALSLPPSRPFFTPGLLLASLPSPTRFFPPINHLTRHLLNLSFSLSPHFLHRPRAPTSFPRMLF